MYDSKKKLPTYSSRKHGHFYDVSSTNSERPYTVIIYSLVPSKQNDFDDEQRSKRVHFLIENTPSGGFVTTQDR